MSFAVPFWFLSGRANLKAPGRRAHDRSAPRCCTYNEPFVQFLREEKARGRRILLVSASDRALVEKVAAQVGLFDEVLASDGQTNLRSEAKRDALVKKFGQGGFDYAGNSYADIAGLGGDEKEHRGQCAQLALAARMRADGRVAAEFAGPPDRAARRMALCARTQWVKNIIIFVPLITAHKLRDAAAQPQSSLLAFAAFCLFASGVYVLNDLFRPRVRPAARAQAPPAAGLRAAVSALCFRWRPAAAAGAHGAVADRPAKIHALGAAGLWRDHHGLFAAPEGSGDRLDVFVLAGLYTMRLVAGHIATGIEFSSWLLGFSMFIFLSLAMMKRLQELQSLRERRI